MRIVIIAGVAAIVACGLDVTGVEPASVTDAGPSAAPAPSTTSTPVVDAGPPDTGVIDTTPKQGPIACDSYRDCEAGEVCCYTFAAGSACTKMPECKKPGQALCRLEKDECGGPNSCRTLATPPAEGIGSCRDKDGEN